MPDTTATERDARHLLRAIELAGRARGQTSPNPLVGAVVVKAGRVIGEGITQPPGEAHAERDGARRLRARTRPGRRCTCRSSPAATTAARRPAPTRSSRPGIARVVIASDDPTPRPPGRGLGILRDEGVDVSCVDGEIADAARLLNQPFRKHARTGRPLVVFKSAMTLDGKVATRTGDSQWISGEASRARAHRWRAESDAVAVGIGTALADDPLLTARVEGVARQPRRVVFDSEARLPLDSQLVRGRGRGADDRRLLARRLAHGACRRSRPPGVDVIVATGENEARARRGTRSTSSAQRDVQSLLLEGGPHLAGAFLEAGEIDEVRMFIAPLLLGGREASTAVEGRASRRSRRRRGALAVEVERIDDDVLIIARLREW